MDEDTMVLVSPRHSVRLAREYMTIVGKAQRRDFVVRTITRRQAAGALLMTDLQGRVYHKRGIARLFALMPLELVVYRPIMAWARLKGTWRFLRGDRAWHKFERNARAEAV